MKEMKKEGTKHMNKGNQIHLADSSPFCIRETNFVISGLLSCTLSPF